jgi:hypothetical protein
MGLQTTRTYGIVVALVVLSGFAGCSALGGGSSGSCGPGDAEIGDLEPDTGTVSIEGEVSETGTALIVVEDGTGTASVMTQADAETGDCVTVDGRTQTGGMGTEADVTIVAQNVSSA